MKIIKCTIVGDPFTGKGSLLRTYVNGVFRQEAEPIIFDNFLVKHMSEKNKEYQLTLWYANGMEEYDRLRPLSYPGSHMILLCFAINSPESYLNIRTKWRAELSHYCPASPILLVGLKADLRSDDDDAIPSESQADINGSRRNRLITFAEGEAMAEEIGAVKYMEASSTKNYGLQELFSEAVRYALLISDFDEQSKKCKGSCLLS